MDSCCLRRSRRTITRSDYWNASGRPTYNNHRGRKLAWGVADLQGPQLMIDMQSHAERFDTEVINDHIHSADLNQRPFELVGDQATTAVTLLLLLPGRVLSIWARFRESFKGRGVSACATCDGFFYRGRSVAVVGGGNTAVEEALYLANLAESVKLIHRRDTLRAERILQDRLFAKGNIEILWNHRLDEVLGDEAG